MAPHPWRDEVVRYIRAEASPADKYGHQPRLYALASHIAQGPEFSESQSPLRPCDDDVLFAAAWMHDLGVFVGHRPADPKVLTGWNHVPYTIGRTRELLQQWGFPPEKLDAVAEAIRTHQPTDRAQMPEAIVLRDADILEQLGAIGALRTFVKVGRDTRYATWTDVVPVLEKALAELPAKLQLQRSMQLAEPRITALSAFLRAIREEAGDLLF
jgi:uncharacterized protein